MSLLRQLAKAVGLKSEISGYSNHEVQHLAKRVDELVDFVSREARAYATDRESVVSGDASASVEDIQKIALLSVTESKAYSAASLEQFARTLSATALAVVELRDQVDQLAGTSRESDTTFQGVEDRLVSLNKRLHHLTGSKSDDVPASVKLSDVEQIDRSVAQLQSLLDDLRRVLDRFHDQLAAIEGPDSGTDRDQVSTR